VRYGPNCPASDSSASQPYRVPVTALLNTPIWTLIKPQAQVMGLLWPRPQHASQKGQGGRLGLDVLCQP